MGSFVQRQTEAAALYVQMCALYVASDDRMKNNFEIESKTLNEVFTVNVYYKKTKNILQRAWRFLKAHLLGWKYILLHFGKPDLIHLNILWPAGIFAYYLKLFSGAKYILTENWTGYLASDGAFERSSAPKKFLTGIISRAAEIITPVSIDLKNAMEKHHLGSRFEIVYNVVDTSVFFPAAISNKEDRFTFLHVSTTLDEQKNVSGILRAVKMLSQKRTDFILKIVSEKDFSFHEKTAAELGILNKYVFLKNAKPLTGVAEEMRKAHSFVLFSNYENLPVVILEAMASGLPVISSTAGGVPEHIKEEYGMLIQPKDEYALCNAMKKMLDERKNYDSKKIREYAVENFSYESVGKKFEMIYRKAMRND